MLQMPQRLPSSRPQQLSRLARRRPSCPLTRRLHSALLPAAVFVSAPELAADVLSRRRYVTRWCQEWEQDLEKRPEHVKQSGPGAPAAVRSLW